jgi:hypothetical protein
MASSAGFRSGSNDRDACSPGSTSGTFQPRSARAINSIELTARSLHPAGRGNQADRLVRQIGRITLSQEDKPVEGVLNEPLTEPW